MTFRSTLTHSPARRRARLLAAALAVPLVLAACGSDDSTTPADDVGSTAAPSDATDASFPVEVLSGDAETGTAITIEARPESIVSLSPTSTEMLWAVGAGEQVVAVDERSDYPEDVPVTDLSGHTTNMEAVLSYEPDLIVAADDPGDLVSSMEAAGVPTLLLPAATDLEDTYEQIERVGTATGNAAEAVDLVETMRSDIEAVLSDLPERSEPITYFHELDPSLFTATSDTFIGQVYALFGMENIADAAGSGDDYPQLSAEYVVEADPDVILLADGQCCGVTLDTVAERPGWADVSAVRSGQVHVLDEDVASRWGPRVVELIELIGSVAADLEPAATG